MNRIIGGKKVFVIHGTDKENRERLKNALSRCGLSPIVLSEQEPLGASTIIEKFEHVAKTCNFAIALLTPDDKFFENLTGLERFRARQNVLIELGWFMAYLGRNKTYLVVVGDVEIPSDIVGIEVYRAGVRVNSRPTKLKGFLKSLTAR